MTQDSPVTPAMQQYLVSKAAHPDCLLLYRMGDFYELFFDDALKASAVLGIALTKRGKHQGQDIAMCGVPAHAVDSYLETLIASGAKVAICEQMENAEEAKKRGPKSVMRREVIRIVTPGTITEETLLDARSSNYLCALAHIDNIFALAIVELSTGIFFITNPSDTGLNAELARIDPREIVISNELADRMRAQEFWNDYAARTSLRPAHVFDANHGERSIREYYNLGVLDALGMLEPADLAACGALLDYIALTQIARHARLDLPRKQASDSLMAIDPATRRNLELTITLAGQKKGSLLSVIDETITGGGARLLSQWLSAPLTDVDAIYARLDRVSYFVDDADAHSHIRNFLKAFPDMERALSRLCLGRGSPRDLNAIGAALHTSRLIKQYFWKKENASLPASLYAVLDAITLDDGLTATLSASLKEELPLLARDGNFIRDGYSADLDEFRNLRDEGKRLITALEMRYQQETGINSLKIRYNNVLGYYAEITVQHQKKIKDIFIHRQSLANNLRYTTVELGNLERRIAEAADRALKLELELFEQLVLQVTSAATMLAQMAQSIATLDVAVALAQLALHHSYSRPTLDNSCEFNITGGRHPVVEQGMRAKAQQSFIHNDCNLPPASRLWLLTGPNMAGKSTFLRQNALIAILAQMGSFVPAISAHIGVVDKIFSRVGAADDLARGRSTFMVEMVETATILHQATARSLVILDEIGRGTATFDGLSIAWAVVEHLHNMLKCRALFATHYHEMTALASTLPALSCHTMKVKEWKGNVVFLHSVAGGVADRSYGIHVARLAGLPEPVLKRANHILHILEDSETAKITEKITDDMPLFRSQPPTRSNHEITALPPQVTALLNNLHPDTLTPKAALELVYELHGAMKEQ